MDFEEKEEHFHFLRSFIYLYTFSVVMMKRARSLSNESFSDPKEAIHMAKLDRCRREYRMNFEKSVPSEHWNNLSWIQAKLFSNEDDDFQEQEDLKTLRERYKKKFKKNVAIRHVNNVDWIKEKLNEESESDDDDETDTFSAFSRRVSGKAFGRNDREDAEEMKELNSLREQYKKKFNKNLAVRFQSDIQWIKKKLEEESSDGSVSSSMGGSVSSMGGSVCKSISMVLALVFVAVLGWC